MITELTTTKFTTALDAGALVTVVSTDAGLVTTLAVPGPQGPQGVPGSISNSDQFFLTANKFSELDTPQKKADARANLELQQIDCGEFY